MRSGLQAYRDLLASDRWLRLLNVAPRSQRLLWASTAPRIPSLGRALLKSLAAPHSVNTIPRRRYLALADHGEIGRHVSTTAAMPRRCSNRFTQAGVDLEAIAADLQRDGAGSVRQVLGRPAACCSRRARRSAAGRLSREPPSPPNGPEVPRAPSRARTTRRCASTRCAKVRHLSRDPAARSGPLVSRSAPRRHGGVRRSSAYDMA